MDAAMLTTPAPTAADYARIFEEERMVSYPVIDAFEQVCGYAIDRATLEAAARVLACPVKKHPPNWQHGRVLYAVARQYLECVAACWVNILDIGTAKGFSALCLHWALIDSGIQGEVISVDVIAPHSPERRNTVAEIEGPVTLAEIHAPWPETQDITFLQSTGIDFLRSTDWDRIHVAFVDGKHDGAVVTTEARMMAARQVSGDLVVFDDAHLPGLSAAIDALAPIYALERLTPKPGRAYVIARRR